MVEATLALTANDLPAGNPVALPGFVLEHTDGTATFAAITANGTCVVGDLATPSTRTGVVKEGWDRELPLGPGATVTLRLLYRRDMFELYVNDYLLPVYLIGGVATGRFGLLPNAAAKQFSGLKAWNMSLPGTATWPAAGPPPPPPPAPVPPPKGDVAVLGHASCDGFFRNDPAYSCNRGNDGNLGTRWSSVEPYDGSPRWLAVDLGKVTAIKSVRLVWEKAYAKGYAIQTSSEMTGAPTVWTTAYQSTAGTGGTETVPDLALSGRHFRVYCTARFEGSPYGFSLYEFELFGSSAPPQHTLAIA